MPEWSIGAVSKTVVPLRVPRVRIPVSPLTSKAKNHKPLKIKYFSGFLFTPKSKKKHISADNQVDFLVDLAKKRPTPPFKALIY